MTAMSPIALLLVLTSCALAVDERDDTALEMSVGWVSPVEGDLVSGILDRDNCMVEVSDPDTIARVEFLVDGQLLGTATTAPFTCRWDTASVDHGAHEIWAIAYDHEGNAVSTSATVIVPGAIALAPAVGSQAASIDVTVEGGLSATGSDYWVDSGVAHDGNGSNESPWKTLAHVNSKMFKPGDVIHVKGSFRTTIIGDNGSGTSSDYIRYVGDGPGGLAEIGGVALTGSAYVSFSNFKISHWGHAPYPAAPAGCNRETMRKLKPESTLVRLSGSAVKFITLDNITFYDADSALVATNLANNITVSRSTISKMWRDGILLNDSAGDKLTVINSSIKNTGNRGKCNGWNVHGVYPSGGHGHLFDHVQFADNKNGTSITMRRGNTTVRYCRFNGGNLMLNNNNEDKANLNGVYQIYRNVFVGPGVAIYQGSTNDGGDVDSNNTWAVFNNTFVNTKVDFGASYANGYRIYVRNNLFANTKVQMPANDSAAHVLSSNGWYGAGTTYTGKAAKGFGITANPGLDSARNVTSTAYANAGVASITPQITMSSSATHPMGYKAGKPDIGMNER